MSYYFLIILLFFSGFGKSNGKAGIQDERLVVITDPVTEPSENELSDSVDKTHDVSSYSFFIGTYTGSGSNGIYRAEFNSDSGTISIPEISAELNNPSFQSISSNGKLLWSVAETGNGTVEGFLIDSNSGKLEKTATFSTLGSSPCYVDFDENTQNIIVANYSSGNVTKLPVTNEGKTAGKPFSHQHTGKGANPYRQEGPHAHCAKIDYTGKHIYSCDLGTDKVYIYRIKGDSLELIKSISTAPGSGPRHLDFHPQLKSMSVINELDGTIATYLPDSNGFFTIFNGVVSTLPGNYNGFKSCADIHYSPDGKFLYASNRGHNSIVCFKIEDSTQKLTAIDWLTEGIKTPRNFTIDPSGNYILVANQDGDSITVYKIDRQTGKLTFTGNSRTISKPVCITFLNTSQK